MATVLIGLGVDVADRPSVDEVLGVSGGVFCCDCGHASSVSFLTISLGFDTEERLEAERAAMRGLGGLVVETPGAGFEMCAAGRGGVAMTVDKGLDIPKVALLDRGGVIMAAAFSSSVDSVRREDGLTEAFTPCSSLPTLCIEEDDEAGGVG